MVFSYELESPGGWPGGIQAQITDVMDEACAVFNSHWPEDVEKVITVKYIPGHPTAEGCWVSPTAGYIGFGGHIKGLFPD